VDDLNIGGSDDENSSEGEEEASTRAKSKGKVVSSKSSAKNVNKKDNPKKKRKITSTTSSPTPLVPRSQGNELPFPDESTSASPMTQLSLIFKASLVDVGDDNLVRTFQMISTICNAPTLSHESLRGSASAISPEFLFAVGSM
ncbi:hypothetical protein MKW92_027135, partial [Papaver armeniacum]